MRRLLLLPFVLAATAAIAAPANVNLSDMDNSAAPGADFFRTSNGGWLAHAQIPADRSYAGVNLELDLSNDARLKAIADGLLTKADPSVEERKLRDLYAAFLDEKAINAQGLTPLAPDLARIAAAKSPDDIVRLMADPALGLDGPFSVGLGADAKHPKIYAVQIGQSGLGMPDRDYYLKNDAALAATRKSYQHYLAAMLGFAGVKDAARADAVYALEKRIADASWAAEDRRDAEKTYNPLTRAALTAKAPQFPWESYFAASGIALSGRHGPRGVIAAEVTAFPALAKIFADTPVPVWRDYLTVRLLHQFSDYLPHDIDQADFAFYGTVLGGNAKQLDRKTRAIHLLDSQMGEALGKLYTARYFPPVAKAKAEILVHNLLTAYDRDLDTLDWMTPATRTKAKDKLSKIMVKVGYPDHWRDYSALVIPAGDIVGAIKNATRFEWQRQLTRIDDPVDRTEWEMTPSTNNAYYEDTLNEIVFPAGILQPPYFDPKADDAVNYGEIGATIGHEISHGFDDQGSKFDGDGILQNWWTAADAKNFGARTTALAKQYDAYQPLPGLHINGKLTLGENIADLAGIEIAFKAYHIALNGKMTPVLDGLTGDQRFFIAYGQSWREIWREARTRKIVLSNPHAPSAFRVNGVVRNVDGWYAAFPAVKPGDTYWLAPKDRVKLW